MRSPFHLFRRSRLPRLLLGLAMLLQVASATAPMPQASAAITDPAQVLLALLSPDLCHPLLPGQKQAPAPVHPCLLCPVCLAHAAVTASVAPALPLARGRALWRIGVPLRGVEPPAIPSGAPRARGPPGSVGA